MSLTIDGLIVMNGEIPRRAKKLIRSSAAFHRDQLRDNWRRAQRRLPLVPIAPLE